MISRLDQEVVACLQHAPFADDVVLNLAGEWRCALDAEDVGIAESLASGKVNFHHAIPLPGTTDLAKLGTHRSEAHPFGYHLTREWEFTGAAWYARSFEIPESWAGREVELVLERVMWQSRVWVNGVESGAPMDSLCTPHVHGIGKLSSGTHELVLRVDNRMIHPIGDKGHAYGDQTQSTWNGVVGAISLRLKAGNRIDFVRVFPSLNGTVQLEVSGRSNGSGSLSIEAYLTGENESFPPSDIAVNEACGDFRLVMELCHPGTPRLWSEFDPALYKVHVNLLAAGFPVDRQLVRFGFREVAREGNKLLINRKPAFMRGNLECALFPKTGHPPMDVESWKKIWRVYQEYGMNHARFHSWCPPEAAFVAADEMGIYLQVEAPIWMDRWMAAPNSRLEMDTAGHPLGLGKGDRSNDEFAKSEIRRILDTYGNHPSFLFFCIGNELGTSDFDVTGEWIAEAKKHDPRHLFAASTARTITPHCDFNATHSVPGIGSVRQHQEFGTAWDYEGQYGRTTLPIIAHEIGQWPVYVDWDAELPRYTGPVKPYRLLQMRDAAQKAGLLDQATELHDASGLMNRLLYRDEIESFLRTPSCCGFQLLGMQDFTGQGEAMVGWLDPFYESKGTTLPAEFRKYCAPTVPLLKLPAYVFGKSEKPVVKALLHHYGNADLADVEVTWRLLASDGKILDSGTLGSMAFATGAVHDCDDFTPSFEKVTGACQCSLEINIGHAGITNSYPLWVFPEPASAAVPNDVFVTSDWNEETRERLRKGGKVLLIANELGGSAASEHAQWRPLYWSVPFFPGQNRDTLGLLVRNDHQVFRGFPTESFGDWNWFRICKGAKGFDLTDLVPIDFRPMAQPVTDFHLNRRIGSIFEAKVGGGSLLVCGYNLSQDRAQQVPEISCLRDSILSYANSPDFAPQTELAIESLDQLFNGSEEHPASVDERFRGADLYVRSAGLLMADGDAIPWDREYDAVLIKVKGVDYTVQADGVCRDEVGAAWHGRIMKITFKPRAGVPGRFLVRFHDWKQNGRTGRVIFEGVEHQLADHREGVWMEFPVIREDTNDGQLLLTTEVLSGPNLMITDIAFMPSE